MIQQISLLFDGIHIALSKIRNFLLLIICFDYVLIDLISDKRNIGIWTTLDNQHFKCFPGIYKCNLLSRIVCGRRRWCNISTQSLITHRVENVLLSLVEWQSFYLWQSCFFHNSTYNTDAQCQILMKFSFKKCKWGQCCPGIYQSCIFQIRIEPNVQLLKTFAFGWKP